VGHGRTGLNLLAAIGDGLGNKAIARKLDISLHTVKFHIESLFRKLGARSRAEVVAKGLARRKKEIINV
jgi:DNA-binding CsgD family transcriptional regulator